MSRDLKSNVGLRYDYLGVTDDRGSVWAVWSGKTIVGSIGVRATGLPWARIRIFGYEKTTKQVSSLASAKRFVERNWARMLDQAGLQVKP